MKKILSLFLLTLVCSLGMIWAAPGDEIKSVSNIVSGKSYYLKGIYTASKVDHTIYYGPTESDESTKDVKVQSAPVTSIDAAMPITFTQVTGGWTLTTPNGMYLRPHSSNGQSYFCTAEVILTLSAGATKEGANMGILIGGYMVNTTEWKMQVNKTASKIGGYSSAQYALTLIEADESKTPTSLTFGSYDAEINVGDEFTEPTLTADPNSILTSVTYSGNNDAVATVNSSTGALSFTGLDGDIKVTATYAGDETYKSSSASYTLTVVDPSKIVATFDLSANQYEWSSTSDGSVYFDGSTYTPAVEGAITMSVFGNVRMWGSSESSLRLYGESAGQDPNIYTYGKGSVTFTAAAGFQITSIKFTGSSLTFTCEEGTYTNPAWAGNATSVTLEKGSNTPQIKSAIVTYVALSEDITLGTAGYSTFAAPYNYTVTGATAYKAAIAGETITLTALEGIIPANTGVILEGTAGATVTITPSAEAATANVDGNALVGTLAPTAFDAVANNTLYCLKANTNEFHPVTSGTIPAGKAYLPVAVGSAPIRYIISGEQTATSIEAIEAEQAVKFIENGQLIIIKNGVRYNALGQIVK